MLKQWIILTHMRVSKHYLTYTFLDYPNNKHIAVETFMTGCSHNCFNCQSPDLQDYYGIASIDITIDEFILRVKEKALIAETNKLVLCGGDPLFFLNIKDTNLILDSLSKDFDICIYTGYDIDYCKDNITGSFKFLKCGVYDENKKVISEKTNEYIQWASINQKLYDSNFNLLSERGKYYF